MKKHSTANVLLIELALVILFFMLCVSVIVEVFGAARLKSADARASSRAMIQVENLEARLAGAETAEEVLLEAGFLQEDGRWYLSAEGYTLTAAEETEAAAAGTLRTVTFTAARKGGDSLFSLPVTHYMAGEVSP
jgi:hypothetical protein